ncbi:hypothetical protein AB0F81_28600, partial [Actinoplanes sp. NPDC024001]|uniref:hypothetical protein n=1 Tax=Actinoplanes sp. NPDC024001 TaxID=3154598 RepID=UPI00340E6F96
RRRTWRGRRRPAAGPTDRVASTPPRSHGDAGPRPVEQTSPSRPGTVAPELGKRRHGGEPAAAREADDIVTDTQAFGVRTPGGGVVTGREEPGAEPEIKRAFRGK